MNASATGEPRPDTTAEVRALLEALRDLAEGVVSLFASEARRAGLSLGAVLALAVAVAVLGVSAWLLAMAALTALAVTAGASLPASLALAALANAVAVIVCMLLMRRLSLNLSFTATRRVLARLPEDEDAHAAEPA